jgi:hypothetical protein
MTKESHRGGRRETFPGRLPLYDWRDGKVVAFSAEQLRTAL